MQWRLQELKKKYFCSAAMIKGSFLKEVDFEHRIWVRRKSIKRKEGPDYQNNHYWEGQSGD